MAAPTPTARGTPAGIPLRDGFATFITFADSDTIGLWELETTPPGKDGGDPIDTTTFHNVSRRTKYPRSLIEDTEGSFNCAYDPNVETAIEANVNVNQEITVTFNDGSTKAFWGFLKAFNPQSHVEGEMPQASVEFVCTNMDDSFAEQAPVVASVVGT